MPACASSNARTRLSRSKSTPTVHQRAVGVTPELMDPDVAQKHALVAATTAYARAHATDIAERSKSRDSGMRMSKSNASRKPEGRHFPPRESSLRFSQSEKGGYMSSVPHHQRSTASKNVPLVHRAGLGETVISPPSLAGSENTRPGTQARNQWNVISSPTATDHIRKVRSMYYASSVQAGSPIGQPPAKYLTAPRTANPVPERCRSLLSDLGVVSIPAATAHPPATISGNESLDKARDRCLQDFQNRKLRERPSFIMAPFKKRHKKATKKLTKPQVGKVTYDNNMPSSGIDEDVKKPLSGLEKPKRSISNSLRNKIKRVFHRPSNASTTLPVQHVEASREYFGNHGSRSLVVPSSFENIPGHDKETLSRARSRASSLEIPPSLACAKSGESSTAARSEVDASEPGSRVTSWTNSSAGNTVTTRDTKRLSVIHEANPSITSAASVALASSNYQSPPVPRLMAFRNPMSIEGVVEEAPATIDPQRVFSALMKEINGVNPEIEDDTDEGTENDVFVSSRGTHSQTASTLTMQSRMNSTTSGLNRATKATIKNVTPDQPKTPVRTTSVRGAVRIPRADPSYSSTNEESGSQGSGKSGSQITVRRKRSGSSQPRNRPQQIPKATPPTAEQISSRVERSKGRWKTPLEEDSFPFFPKSTKRAYTVTKLARSISRKPSVKRSPSFKQSGSRAQTPALQKGSKNGPWLLPGGVTSPLSPSVYSQASDEQSVKPNDSAVSLVESETGETGTAVIITSHPVKSYVIGAPYSKPRIVNHSARSSKDWKDWLSREVSELEHPQQEDLAINGRYANTGYHRKPVQIVESEDVTIGGSESGIRKASGLLARYHRPKLVENPPSRAKNHSSSRPKLERRSSSRMNDRFPMIDTGRKFSNQSNSPKTLRIRRTPETDTPPTRFSPSPKLKVYSDYTSPLPEKPTRSEQTPTPSEVDKGKEKKDNKKENIQTSTSTKSLCIAPQRLTHPQTSQALDFSIWARSNSGLAHYTTSTADPHIRPSESPATPPRPSLRASNSSSSKIASRPKSAIDLRSPNAHGLPASSATVGGVEKRRSGPAGHPITHVRRKPITGRALEGDTLQMILAGPYSATAVTAACPSPPSRSPPAPYALRKVALGTSSSDLALDKEPDPGFEAGWGIESALGEPVATLRSVESAAGPVTPTTGQRMAERFLRERSAESETPVRLTPAFL
ncbi:uncharacterized protein K441DRAFT_636439 [Cenococcum geophilum 1.58]|uniref:uncharacterized protein n=1 Tax=Cenococcum geophilum 1.58 TaxID=794803 RepID=UPI00358ED19C|nr:hypothetical protein K441DRAFT_636439 [Cenococcum geophilum 1.58]